MLLKNTNLTLTDLRGKREVHHIREEPRGLAAALGRVTPRGARLGMAGVLGLGLLASAQSGFVGPLAASVILAVALNWVGELDVEETETRHTIQSPGMTARELDEFWILNDAHEQLKKDKAEKARRQAEQRAKAQQGGV